MENQQTALGKKKLSQTIRGIDGMAYYQEFEQVEED